mgnify:CR=1 FL=1
MHGMNACLFLFCRLTMHCVCHFYDSPHSRLFSRYFRMKASPRNTLPRKTRLFFARLDETPATSRAPSPPLLTGFPTAGFRVSNPRWYPARACRSRHSRSRRSSRPPRRSGSSARRRAGTASASARCATGIPARRSTTRTAAQPYAPAARRALSMPTKEKLYITEYHVTKKKSGPRVAAAPSRVKSSAAANHRAPPSADGRKLPDPL